jgi:hypothetical protein
VVQHGVSDGGSAPADQVATNAYVVALKAPAGFSYTSPYNAVDAALAKLNGVATANRVIRALAGPVKALATMADIQIDDEVVFVGKESDYSEARVCRFVARVKVLIRGTTYNFGDLFQIESRLPIYVGSLVKKGDSGSWVVRETNESSYELYGLLVAKDQKRALCCFIETVCAELAYLAGVSFDTY